MPSPLCEVKDGAAAYVPAGPGVDITPGNTVVIRLSSQAGVGPWSCTLATADEITSIAAINASLVIDSVAKTATFTAPAAGRALRFQSRVNQGKNTNNVNDDSLTTTFCLYTRAASGNRVHALDETTEGNVLAGWGADVNAMLRTGGGGGGATLPVNRPCVEKGASYGLVASTDYQVVFTGAGPWTATLWATPAVGDECVITNESSSNVTVASSGGTLGFLVAGSTTVAPGQSVTYRKSTSANWVAS